MNATERAAAPVALITGAASGIGRSTAEVLGERGYRLVLVDLPSREGSGAAPADAEAVMVAGDVTDEAVNAAMVAAAEDAFDRLDAVVLNAGVSPRTAPIDVGDLDEFDRSIDVNLRSVVLGIRAAVPLLRRVGGGAIVVTASVTGLGGEAGRWHYAAAKAGVINLARSAAIDLAASGIRVNTVCPGPVETGMTGRLDAGHREELRRMVPLQRWGTAREVAEVLAFLVSPQASFVTGVAVPVDGGIAAGSGIRLPPFLPALAPASGDAP